MHVHADYERYDWNVLGSCNDADFYDLFGPTKTSRKGYSVAVGHTTILIDDAPRRMKFALEGRVAGNLDQLPEYQNVHVKVDRLLALDAQAVVHERPDVARPCRR